MEFTDKELRIINTALQSTNEQLLNNNIMPDEESEHWFNKLSSKITDNVLLSRKITKYIKGDDEDEMD